MNSFYILDESWQVGVISLRQSDAKISKYKFPSASAIRELNYTLLLASVYATLRLFYSLLRAT